MKIGLSTATFFGKELTEDTFGIIKSTGVSVCEVFMTTFSEYAPEFGALLKERSEGAEVYSVHSLNTHYEPMLFNVAKRTVADAEAILKMFLTNAQLLNAKSYTFHGPTRLKRTPYNINFESFGRRVNELIGITESFGLNLSYENVHWAYFNTPDFFAQLKKICPNLKCTLDIKQAMQSGLSFEDFIPVMADRLNNVHICDYDENGAVCIPGRGSVDFKKLFSMLKDVGYDGNLMVELYSKNYDNYGEVKSAVDYLRSLL